MATRAVVMFSSSSMLKYKRVLRTPNYWELLVGERPIHKQGINGYSILFIIVQSLVNTLGNMCIEKAVLLWGQ